MLFRSKNLGKKRVVIFDIDEFVLIASIIFLGVVTKHIVIAAVSGIIALNFWKRLKHKEHNFVKNLRYKFLGKSMGLRNCPESYIKKYYG